jgi:hypothetical protein
VNGIEVTQAIQYYRAGEHLTDAADRGADNSVRLVTNKTAWVRLSQEWTGSVLRRRAGARCEWHAHR